MLSTLNPGSVQQVQFESHGWKITLTPDHLKGEKPVEIEEGGIQGGLRVMLDLKKPLHAPNQSTLKLLLDARGSKPLTLHVSGTPHRPLKSCSVRITETRDAEIHVCFDPPFSVALNRLKVIVDHKPILVEFPERQGVEGRGIMTALGQVGRIEVHPKSNARIQLSSPGVLQDDEHLRVFLQGVSDQVHLLFMSLFEGMVVPDPVHDLRKLPWLEPFRSWQQHQSWHWEFERLYLRELGFQPVLLPEVKHFRADPEMGFLHQHNGVHHTRMAVQLAEPQLAQVWNVLWKAGHRSFGVPASEHDRGARAEIQTDQPDSTEFFQYAQISVLGMPLPFLVQDHLYLHPEHLVAFKGLLVHPETKVQEMLLALIIEVDPDRFDFSDTDGNVDLEGYRLSLLFDLARFTRDDQLAEDTQRIIRHRTFNNARASLDSALLFLEEACTDSNTLGHIQRFRSFLPDFNAG